MSNKFEERAQPFAWQDFRRPSAIPIPIDGLAVYRSGCEMMLPNEIIRPPQSRMEFLAMTPDAIRWNEVWRSVFMTLSMNLGVGKEKDKISVGGFYGPLSAIKPIKADIYGAIGVGYLPHPADSTTI